MRVSPPRLLTAYLVLVMLATPTRGNGQEVTPDAIRQAWITRQEQCKTVSLSLSWQSLVPKGLYDPLARMADRDDKSNYPQKDKTVEGGHEILLDGGRYRIRRTGEVFITENKSFAKAVDQYTLSKSKQVNYNVSTASKSHGTAHLHNSDYKLSELQTSMVQPVVLSFRGAYGGLPFGDLLAEYESSKQVTTIDGKKCVGLVRHIRVQDLSETLWVDTERGMQVVRRVTMMKSQVVAQVDVKLESHPQAGWIPKSWKSVTHTADGRLAESVTCTVTAFELGTSTSDSDFEPVFPPGTHVMDHTSGSLDQYVVQSDGNEGGRIPTRQLPTYERLATTPATPTSAIWTYVIVGLAGLGLVVTCIWAWNRFLRRNRPTPPNGGTA